MLTEEAAWSCTTCGYCVEVCPVGNEPMVDILRVRQDLVMMESKFPKDAMETFEKMENYGNPWGHHLKIEKFGWKDMMFRYKG